MILALRGRWGISPCWGDGGGIQGVRYPWVAATIGASHEGEKILHEHAHTHGIGPGAAG